MKAILVLCLLASISCFNIINAGICLIGNEKIRTVAGEVISSIKEKDFGKIFSLIILNFSEIKEIVSKCLKEENDDVLLKTKKIRTLALIPCPVGCCNPRLTTCTGCRCR